MGKEHERIFTKEEIQMAYKHMINVHLCIQLEKIFLILWSNVKKNLGKENTYILSVDCKWVSCFSGNIEQNLFLYPYIKNN